MDSRRRGCSAHRRDQSRNHDPESRSAIVLLPLIVVSELARTPASCEGWSPEDRTSLVRHGPLMDGPGRTVCVWEVL